MTHLRMSECPVVMPETSARYDSVLEMVDKSLERPGMTFLIVVPVFVDYSRKASMNT